LFSSVCLKYKSNHFCVFFQKRRTKNKKEM